MSGRVEVKLKIEKRAMHGDWPWLGKASGRSSEGGVMPCKPTKPITHKSSAAIRNWPGVYVQKSSPSRGMLSTFSALVPETAGSPRDWKGSRLPVVCHYPVLDALMYIHGRLK